MTRVSLTEDYDDRSVISKLNEMDKRVKENASVVTAAEESARASAESAQETADRFAGSVGAVVQNANAQINASKAKVDQAKSEVDATVTTVAQAVQTVNNASASAQASATTVATYGTRLTAVEDKAQGNSADIDHLEIETRDLYDRDANSVKLSPSADQTISRNVTFENNIHEKGILYVERYQAAVELDSTSRRMADKTLRGNAYGSIVIRDADDKVCTLIQSSRDLEDDGSIKTSITGYNNLGESNYISIYRDNVTTKTPSGTVPSNAIVNKAYVEATNPATRLNNLVHNVDAETINGVKTFGEPVKGFSYYELSFFPFRSSDAWWKVCTLTPQRMYMIEITKHFPYNNATRYYAKVMINLSAPNVQGSCHVQNIISKGPSGNIGDIIVGQTAYLDGSTTKYRYELFVFQTRNANLRVNCTEISSTVQNYGVTDENITLINTQSEDPRTISGLTCIVEEA